MAEKAAGAIKKNAKDAVKSELKNAKAQSDSEIGRALAAAQETKAELEEKDAAVKEEAAQELSSAQEIAEKMKTESKEKAAEVSGSKPMIASMHFWFKPMIVDNDALLVDNAAIVDCYNHFLSQTISDFSVNPYKSSCFQEAARAQQELDKEMSISGGVEDNTSKSVEAIEKAAADKAGELETRTQKKMKDMKKTTEDKVRDEMEGAKTTIFKLKEEAKQARLDAKGAEETSAKDVAAIKSQSEKSLVGIADKVSEEHDAFAVLLRLFALWIP